MMSAERIDLRTHFSISFSIYLGNNDGGADGAAFVLHNDPLGAGAIGIGGGGLGATNIANGLAIQFDTYQNVRAGDIANDHTNIIRTGVPLAQSRLTDQFDLGNIEDGHWHKVAVTWDAGQHALSYSVDGTHTTTFTNDIVNSYFAGSDFVHFGFTASTGGGSNLQQVQVTEIDATLEDGSQVHANLNPVVTIPALGMDFQIGGAGHYDAASNTTTLTSDAHDQLGEMMSAERIDLRTHFSISFSIYLGNNDGGADGAAFVLHNDPLGAGAIGIGGGGLGATNIANGLAIQFDTYQNVGAGDIANDHTNIIRTGVPLAQSRLTDQFDLGNIEDGHWHKVAVTWDAGQHALSYSVDGTHTTTFTNDIVNSYFAGSDFVHFGFTASTGGGSNLQQVQVTEIDATLEDGSQVHANLNPVVTIPALGMDFQIGGAGHYDAASNTTTLTSDAHDQLGEMMSAERIDLRTHFSISFSIYLGNNDGGADGAAFVLHNDPLGAGAIGIGGGGLGATNIANGLAIQFDTYQNVGAGDIANDHTNIIRTGVPLAQSRLTDQFDLGNIEDGHWHKVAVTWDAGQHALSYSVDGTHTTTFTNDIVNSYFAGSDFVHFGFTASTGGGSNLQQVQVTEIDATLEDGSHVVGAEFAHA